ncbi:glycosyl transferase [Legionella antarctica]|uniref:Glycosyl transferase n=1 Tax=Legionella antarctica TaxID=2708020 RepID=A0A6F8T3B3_9GAMM|nr:glycosyltransferase family 2 protein [Legionella antarctica]BCA94929.1 glycosyl transferase [Legionella antarctica]
MKISIVTACYNSVATISDTLRTIQMQTHQDVEHIIIDGGSTDGTLEILEKNKAHIAHLTSERDNGLYDAMNRGISKATGDIIGLLNSDDMLAHKDVLSTIANKLADPRVDACYGDLVYVQQHNIDKVVRYWKSCPYRTELFGKGWMPAHPTFYVRKEVHDKYSMLFNLDYKSAADYEVVLRLLFTHKINVAYIPEIMVKMRLGGTSNQSIKNIIDQNKSIMRALNSHNYEYSSFKMFCNKLLDRVQQYRKVGYNQEQSF